MPGSLIVSCKPDVVKTSLLFPEIIIVKVQENVLTLRMTVLGACQQATYLELEN